MRYGINNPRPTPSQDLLQERFNYNAETGSFSWKKLYRRNDLIGKECNTINTKQGHYSACVGRVSFAVHRLIYKYMTGNEPDIIDHINGNPQDNRWVNLRSVTHHENMKNMSLPKSNKSGFMGVRYRKDHNRWQSSVNHKGKTIHLGYYETKEEGLAARKAANIILGFTSRHGESA